MLKEGILLVLFCITISKAYPTFGLFNPNPVVYLPYSSNEQFANRNYQLGLVGDTFNPYSGWRSDGISNQNYGSYGNVGSYSGWKGLGQSVGWRPSSSGWRG